MKDSEAMDTGDPNRHSEYVLDNAVSRPERDSMRFPLYLIREQFATWKAAELVRAGTVLRWAVAAARLRRGCRNAWVRRGGF